MTDKTPAVAGAGGVERRRALRRRVCGGGGGDKETRRQRWPLSENIPYKSTFWPVFEEKNKSFVCFVLFPIRTGFTNLSTRNRILHEDAPFGVHGRTVQSLCFDSDVSTCICPSLDPTRGALSLLFHNLMRSWSISRWL